MMTKKIGIAKYATTAATSTKAPIPP